MYDPVPTQLRAAHIESALQEKLLSVQSSSIRYSRFAFLLDMGQAGVQTTSGELELSGPALYWGPVEDETRLRLDAGSAGTYLFIGDQAMAQAIDPSAHSAPLRQLSDQHIVATFARGDALSDQLDALFARVVDEGAVMRAGSDIAIAAHIQLLLIALWRKVQEDGDGGVIATDQGVIDLFRQLVETHFRARWSAARYAEALGITYDRLHDHCMRTVGKPPARLIRERCLHEAQILLQRMTLSNERIAAMLGFSSASQFSHFYKSMTGLAPGAYRKAWRQHSGPTRPVSDFSDWP